MTSDGHLVLVHDSKVDRTSNGNGTVNHNSLMGLQKLDFGQWFEPSFTGERIVTLDWLIDFINEHHINVNFELKTNVRGEQENFYLMRLHQAIHRINRENQIIVSSFDVKLLKKFHDLMPKITIGLLLAEPISDNTVAPARSVPPTSILMLMASLKQPSNCY
ncbi:glycerophosphodiester phosphodiesterase family protein [Leuconostoc lactis]|uniref:glycerophosphodiester phosphodiesterase family protein n=1 Tax=Leuconostoc lactis TaxID=1246 RepID=UPI0024316F71|nr:glycerophosphodiester phosphodiesterase family protein [Leuconostoc lactis]